MSFHRALLVGEGGDGKSTQLRTLMDPERPHIFYSADTNTPTAYFPDSVEIVYLDEDPPEFSKGWFVYSGHIPAKAKDKPRLWEDFHEAFYERWYNGRYKEIGEAGGWVFFDSLTILGSHAALLANHVLRQKSNYDGQMEYQAGGVQLEQALYSIGRMGQRMCNVAATAHYRRFQDDKTKQLYWGIDFPGRARGAVLRTFDWVIGCEQQDQGNDKPAKFMLRTVKDEDHPGIRVETERMPNKKAPPALVDGTLDFTKPLTEQGIGRWLNPRS